MNLSVNYRFDFSLKFFELLCSLKDLFFIFELPKTNLHLKKRNSKVEGSEYKEIVFYVNFDMFMCEYY